MKKKRQAQDSKLMTPAQFVEQFFNRAGVANSLKPEQFFKRLERRFGSIAHEFADCVEARGHGEPIDVYRLKNQSLEFANCIAGQYDRDRIKATAVWFLQESWDFSEARFIEVGCDNGILTCLLASLFPQAEFLGIDSCSEAIALAQQRAIDLGLKNIQFRVCTLGEDVRAEDLGQYDFVLGSTVFHEIVDPTEVLDELKVRCGGKGLFSIQELDEILQSEALSRRDLEFTSSLLANDGLFISIDRLPSQEHTLLWIRSVERAGLRVDLSKCYIIEAKGFDGTQERLPITVFSRSQNVPPRACDILSFHSYRNFIDKKLVREIEDPALAEIVYGALDKRPIVHHECVYSDGSGVERLEIGSAHGLGYVYNVTSRGFRRIVLLPTACLYEHTARISEYENSRAALGKTVIRWEPLPEATALGIAPASTAAWEPRGVGD